MSMFPHVDFGPVQTYWVSVKVVSRELEYYESRADWSGLHHRTFYNAPAEGHSKDNVRVMLVRIPVALGDNPQKIGQQASEVLHGMAAAMPIPKELMELQGASIPRDTANHPLSDTVSGTGARDVETALFRRQGGNAFSEPLKLVRLYLYRLSHAQHQLKLKLDGKQTVQWLIDNWQYGDWGCVHRLLTPNKAPSTAPQIGEVEKSTPTRNAAPQQAEQPVVSKDIQKHELPWRTRSDTSPRQSLTPSTRNVLRRLHAQTRQQRAESQPAQQPNEETPSRELAWSPGKEVGGVTSEVATLPDGSTVSVVKSSVATTAALFHGATPVASGTPEQLRIIASDLIKL